MLTLVAAEVALAMLYFQAIFLFRELKMQVDIARGATVDAI